VNRVGCEHGLAFLGVVSGLNLVKETTWFCSLVCVLGCLRAAMRRAHGDAASFGAKRHQ
jgi:hypothetical protein